MKPTRSTAAFALGAAFWLCAPSSASAESLAERGLAQIQQLLKGTLESAPKAIRDIVEGAHKTLEGVVEKNVLRPALEWAADRILPAGEEGFDMLRRLFERRIRGSDALKSRLASYSEMLDALSSKGAAAFDAAMKKANAQFSAIAGFNPNEALKILERIAQKRASDLVRSRLPALLDQALAILTTPLRAKLEGVYAEIRKIPWLGDYLAGLADNEVTKGLAALRDKALSFALGRADALAQSAVRALFAAATGAAAGAEAWMKPIVASIKSLMRFAEDHAARVQAQFSELRSGLASLSDSFKPEKVMAEVKAAERVAVAKALVSAVKGQGAAATAEAKLLVRAGEALASAQKRSVALLAEAAQAAGKRCGGKVACVTAAVVKAKTLGARLVKSAEAKLEVAAKKAEAKGKIESAMSTILSAPSVPVAPEKSAVNSAPVKLTAAAKTALAKVEAAARKEIPGAEPPAQLAAPLTAKLAIAKLGADAGRVAFSPAKGPTAAPMVRAKPATGVAGARAALSATYALMREEWKAARLSTSRALLAARKLLPKAAPRIRAGLVQMFSGAHWMFVAAGRARVLQQRRLYAAAPRGVTALVNRFLARKPSFLGGLYVRAPGPVGQQIEAARRAIVKLTILGQRLVLATKALVGRGRWREAAKAMQLFFGALSRAKRGLRYAAEKVAMASPMKVAKASIRRRRR